MRDLKELHWRSRGPRLPQTVLDAATLRIGAALPETYRQFLSQVDGGRIGRGGFRAAERDWLIGGFFPFADAAGLAEKLRKAGRLPQGFMPVAYADSPEKPLVYMELTGAGRVFLKPSTKSRWEDAGSILSLGESFAEFLDLLGDAPKDGAVVNPPELAAAAPKVEVAAPAPAARPAAKPASPAKARPASKPITSPAAAAARAISAVSGARQPVKAGVKAAAAAIAKAKPVAKAAPAAKPKPAAKAKPVAKAAPAAKPAKTKPAAKAKPAAKSAKAKPAAKAKSAAKAKPAKKAAKAAGAKPKVGARGKR